MIICLFIILVKIFIYKGYKRKTYKKLFLVVLNCFLVDIKTTFNTIYFKNLTKL